MYTPAPAGSVEREVEAVFERYEAALRRHDVETLNGLFLRSASTVRYGLEEQNYGFDAISAYRRSAAPVHPGRRLQQCVISAFGADVACVSVEFIEPGCPRVGRQTQTWVRTREGWKIAVAHVSLMDPTPGG